MADKPVKITTDSTSDLSPELIEKYNISVLPLYIEMDGKSFRDGIDVTTKDVFDYFDQTGKTARTSAANLMEYEAFFKGFVDEGYEVVHIGISSALSSSLQHARNAAESLDGVYVIDSLNLSTGSGLLVLRAAELAQKGLSGKEVADEIAKVVPRVRASFVIETLKFLHAGGRCSALTKFGANLLKIKPSIVVLPDGTMSDDKKYRGSIDTCYTAYIDDALADLESIEPDRIFITHPPIDDEVSRRLEEYVKSFNYFKEVLSTNAGCVISSHCGPGTVGVLYIKKEQ